MKANPKMKADPKAEAAPKSSPKKMIVIALISVAVLGMAGGGAWFFTQGKSDPAKESKKAEKPEFVVLENFTVNLQPEEGEQYLQVGMTLQVSSLEQVELIKTNMARVRNRVLLILSAKKASELISNEGKSALAKEIIASINLPFIEKDKPQEVRDVLFTSFIIQ